MRAFVFFTSCLEKLLIPHYIPGMNLIPPFTLEGERIVLKARSNDQAQEVYNLIDQNREHLKQWMPWEETTRSVEDSEKYIEFTVNAWNAGSMFDYSIYLKSNQKLIGSFGLHNINRSKKTCHFGFWIDKNCQGQGLVSEALAVGEKVARELGFHRLILTCDRLNERSQRVALRSDYKLEAVMIDECMNKNRMRDTCQFVKLINPYIAGAITENLPEGFLIKEFKAEEFWQLTRKTMHETFDDELNFFARDFLNKEDFQKLDAHNENFKHHYTNHRAILYGEKLAGWTWGYQDNRDSYYMVNSAILPEYRGRGLYSELLDVTLKDLTQKGFHKIWSRHIIVNNKIIAAKIKKGFVISGTEINDTFGTLVHLTYYTNKTRKKVLDFRAGYSRPDEELKRILKI